MKRSGLTLIALMMWPLLQATNAYAWRLEAGDVTTIDTAASPMFTSVAFQDTFDVIPVVVALPTDEGVEPAALRIRNVTTSGFEIVVVEPTGNDGPHEGMTIHYVAIEPGVNTLPDGTKIAAGIAPISTIQSKFLPSGRTTVPFGATLDSTATVVAAIQSMNSEGGTVPSGPSTPFLTVSALNANASSVGIALERSEDISGTVQAEDVGWIAFPSSNSGSFLDIADTNIGWDARVTSDTVVGFGNGCTSHTFSATSWPNARIVGNKNTRDGIDGGWVRRCALTATTVGLLIDEDMANDTERTHTSERVALLSFSDSFHANLEGRLQANKTVSTPPGSYALPGNLVTYTIAAQSSGVLPIDEDAVVIVDSLPPEIRLQVTDIGAPGDGPVIFEDGSPASGLSYTFLGLSDATDDLEFSNDGGVSFGYTPVAGGSGTDPNVTHIRINLKGIFLPETGSGNPNFEISFQAVIN